MVVSLKKRFYSEVKVTIIFIIHAFAAAAAAAD